MHSVCSCWATAQRVLPGIHPSPPPFLPSPPKVPRAANPAAPALSCTQPPLCSAINSGSFSTWLVGNLIPNKEKTFRDSSRTGDRQLCDTLAHTAQAGPSPPPALSSAVLEGEDWLLRIPVQARLGFRGGSVPSAGSRINCFLLHPFPEGGACGAGPPLSFHQM